MKQITDKELQTLIDKEENTLVYLALIELQTRRAAESTPKPKKQSASKYNFDNLPPEDPMTAPYAFVDGSFNTETNTYGYGGYLYENGNYHKIQGNGTDPELATMRNVAGEIMGCMAALDLAKKLNISSLQIYYDYSGIEQWATGGWKAKKAATQNYANTMHEHMKTMDIQFVKVAGHTGVTGNEIADKLAKEAVGLL